MVIVGHEADFLINLERLPVLMDSVSRNRFFIYIKRVKQAHHKNEVRRVDEECVILAFKHAHLSDCISDLLRDPECLLFLAEVVLLSNVEVNWHFCYIKERDFRGLSLAVWLHVGLRPLLEPAFYTVLHKVSYILD